MGGLGGLGGFRGGMRTLAETTVRSRCPDFAPSASADSSLVCCSFAFSNSLWEAQLSEEPEDRDAARDMRTAAPIVARILSWIRWVVGLSAGSAEECRSSKESILFGWGGGFLLDAREYDIKPTQVLRKSGAHGYERNICNSSSREVRELSFALSQPLSTCLYYLYPLRTLHRQNGRRSCCSVSTDAQWR